MSAWFIIAPAALIICAATIWLGRLPRKTWEAFAAFAVLGLAGYALQASPNLPAAPAQETQRDNETASLLIDIRSEMAPTFASAKRWTILSDSVARRGNYPLAIAVVNSGLKERPKQADLWAALGLYAMLANEGRIGPPSQLAFNKAREYRKILAAPDYFEGLEALADGRLLDTLKKWEAALKNAPKDSKWGPKVQRQFDGLTAATKKAIERAESQQEDVK